MAASLQQDVTLPGLRGSQPRNAGSRGPSSRSEKYNVVVIGAGTAGLVTAAATAGLGGKVALIERREMGGDCLNFGCVPSKALIASTRQIHAIRRAERYGLEPMEPRFNFDAVFARMRERRSAIAPHDSQERFESLGVHVHRGHARFISPHEVQVDGVTLRARNFVIATGTSPAVPPVPGLQDVSFFTNETIFDGLHEQPARMAILGGGPIGCELGQVFARLGVQVSIIEMAPRLLSKEDADVSEFLQRCLETEGVQAFTRKRATAVRAIEGGIELSLSAASGESNLQLHSTLEADALLVAAGRTPNVGDLGLDAAGVKYNRRGIEVNAYLQTSQPHIYAAGDVVGPYQFTHVADAHARLITRNILMPFLKSKMDYSVVPWCTYTEPEVAHVGLNEAQAREQGIAFDCWIQRFDTVDRAIVADDDAGYVKILTAAKRDRIIGATLVGPHAGELLHEIVLAMKFRIGLGKLSQVIHSYPTLAEVVRKVADDYQRSRLTPLARRVFSWMYEYARR